MSRIGGHGRRLRHQAVFTGTVPGKPEQTCALPKRTGTFVAIRPSVAPGLQAPLAWSLSQRSIDDLDKQRDAALGDGPAEALSDWLHGRAPDGC